MASLNVIALISGGKDSIYSILHLLSLGHRVVCLGNLFPSPTTTSQHDGDDPESHMYQTAGHSMIPYIAKCLDLPLIRREITGSNVSKSATYVKPAEGEGKDETEDLDLLLRKILEKFPEANAVSSGAILSTYQRTRIETVALRLGLIPLAYLWQYTSITTEEGEDALLKHMEQVGMEARIVKVASGGLDEGNLWTDVASYGGRESIKKRIMRFGEGEGAVIGEGGEFETLVLNGPDHVWKYHIVVDDDMRQIVKGEGGTASTAFRIPMDGREVCRLEEKVIDETKERSELVRPRILEANFRKIFDTLYANEVSLDDLSISSFDADEIRCQPSTTWPAVIHQRQSDANIIRFTISSATMEGVIATLSSTLCTRNLSAKDVTSTTVLIKDMAEFPILNKLYSGVFQYANPPSRACVAVGGCLPKNVIAVMHIVAFQPSTATLSNTKALHVQSRSHWAPANIGPYSQAQSFPLSESSSARAVSVAGQIPLVPATMTFPFITQGLNRAELFAYETTLAAQHAWRIGREMGVQLFTTGTAFLPRLSLTESRQKAIVAGAVWRALHTPPSTSFSDDGNGTDEEEEVDLWELQNRRGEQSMGATAVEKRIPDWEAIKVHEEGNTKRGAPDYVSPFCAVEVESLPMNASIEWLPGLGIAGGNIEVLPPNEMMVLGADGVSNSTHEVVVYKTLMAGKWLLTTYIVYLTEELEDWKYLTDSLRSDLNDGPGRLVNGTEYKSARHMSRDAERTYVDVSAPVAKSFWESVEPGVVPCRRLWSAEGRRLAAVVQFKDEVVPRKEMEDEDDENDE